MSPTSWFVVHTRVYGEERAASHLAEQGFRVFLPRYQKVRRHARRRDHVMRPLFPRYLFVSLDLAVDRWRSVRSTVGVADIVRHGDTPTPVPDGVVEQLQARQGEDGCVRLPPRRFAAGQSVRLLDGAFSDMVGLYEGMADTARVLILLELLGRKVRVMLDEAGVEPA